MRHLTKVMQMGCNWALYRVREQGESRAGESSGTSPPFLTSMIEYQDCAFTPDETKVTHITPELMSLLTVLDKNSKGSVSQPTTGPKKSTEEVKSCD